MEIKYKGPGETINYMVLQLFNIKMGNNFRASIKMFIFILNIGLYWFNQIKQVLVFNMQHFPSTVQ